MDDRTITIGPSPDWRSQGGDADWQSDRDETQRLIEMLSRMMDTIFEIPGLGWRFGFDPLIGLIPFVGDAASTLVSLYILALAGRLGIPRITMARMGLNVAIDMLLGSLPIVGDLFDVWWKANQQNADLLRKRLSETPTQSRRATFVDWLFVAAMLVALVALFIGLAFAFVFIVAALWNAAQNLLSPRL